ncbi:MAG: hypothetical protein HY962_16765 [Ignavibacteriae bacterium]|nr:hypothetical protein [Ignavibacteriota bacterium]
MQFQVVIRKTYEGFDAAVPSIRECDSWAHTEDEAIERLLERVRFFLNLEAGRKHSLDVLRKEDGETYYTLTIRDR